MKFGISQAQVSRLTQIEVADEIRYITSSSIKIREKCSESYKKVV